MTGNVNNGRQDAVAAAIAGTPIPPGQIALYKSLYGAGEHWVSSYELAGEVFRGAEKTLQSVLFGLRERINASWRLDGDPPGLGLLLEIKEFHGEVHYRLTPAARVALETLPALKYAMTLTVRDLFRQYSGQGLEVPAFLRP